MYSDIDVLDMLVEYCTRIHTMQNIFYSLTQQAPILEKEVKPHKRGARRRNVIDVSRR